jgi:uncharacterized protein
MATVDLENDFVVPVGIDEAWGLLNDLQAIAPCMPGAVLREADGDEYRGDLSLKVGPIAASYSGVARIVESRVDDRTVVIDARGTGKQGRAAAEITVSLREMEVGTAVLVRTALELGGRLAQFGRTGTMAEISERMIETFAGNLARQISAGGADPRSAGETEGESEGSLDVAALLRSSPAVQRGLTVALAAALVGALVGARCWSRRRGLVGDT